MKEPEELVAADSFSHPCAIQHPAPRDPYQPHTHSSFVKSLYYHRMFKGTTRLDPSEVIMCRICTPHGNQSRATAERPRNLIKTSMQLLGRDTRLSVTYLQQIIFHLVNPQETGCSGDCFCGLLLLGSRFRTDIKSPPRFPPMAVSTKPLLNTIGVDERLHSDACGEPQAWLAYSKLCKGIPLKQFAQILRSAVIKYIEHVGWKLARGPHRRCSYILIESLADVSSFLHPALHSKRTFRNHAKWSL
jgi:hypothetical protein